MDVINILRGKYTNAVIQCLIHLGYFYAGCMFMKWRAKNTRRTRKGIARAMRILLFVSCLIWALAFVMAVTVSN